MYNAVRYAEIFIHDEMVQRSLSPLFLLLKIRNHVGRSRCLRIGVYHQHGIAAAKESARENIDERDFPTPPF